ncbi:MAG: Mov34/MPN/PAD-1 family protein [Dehalococcoidia bacterium]|nr:Mov34/MPN/PAD-1 family protein [Dehalococcoidia bacterium]
MSRLFVVRAVVEAIEEEAKRSRWTETGGVLVGYWSSDDDLVVVDAVVASRRSRRSPSGFESSVPDDWATIEEVVRASSGAFTYIGDWHSHPLGGCRPSRRDFETTVKVSRSRDADTQRPLLWIAARQRPLVGDIEHGAFLLLGPDKLTQMRIRTLDSVPGA